MADAPTLTQVLLRQPKVLEGFKEDVFWIQSEFALKGKKVQDEDGVVWTVVAVYGTRPAIEFESWFRGYGETCVCDGEPT